MDHRNDREEHDEECGEGQRLLKGVPNLVLIGNAVECGEQYDHEQTNQTYRRKVKGKCKHKNDGCDRLNL